MTTQKLSAHRRQVARTLLLNGCSCRQISKELGLSYWTVLKYLKKEEKGWECENIKLTRSQALANSVKLYSKLGFSDKAIGNHYGFSKQWINELRHRPTEPNTIPVADIELLGEVYTVDGKRVEQGFYTVYDLSDTQVFLKSKNGLIFKVNIEPLLLRVRIADGLE